MPSSDQQPYEDFYANWIQKEEDLTRELQEALQNEMDEEELQKIVTRVEKHYEFYYDVKDRAAHTNILKVVNAPWSSPLEKAFFWLGAWRPSMAFQLVYALAGQQVEAELAEFVEGNLDTCTLAALSSLQLSRINELQTATNKEEDVLSDEMAMLQQSLADQPLLSLAQADTLVNGSEEGLEASEDRLKEAMREKLKTLEQISTKADALRKRALKDLFKELTTVQRVQYLVAAAQLQITIRNLGHKMNTDEELEQAAV